MPQYRPESMKPKNGNGGRKIGTITDGGTQQIRNDNADAQIETGAEKAKGRSQDGESEKQKVAGVQGFEPWKWRNQNPLPYRLAIPQRWKLNAHGTF